MLLYHAKVVIACLQNKSNLLYSLDGEQNLISLAALCLSQRAS